MKAIKSVHPLILQPILTDSLDVTAVCHHICFAGRRHWRWTPDGLAAPARLFTGPYQIRLEALFYDFIKFSE